MRTFCTFFGESEHPKAHHTEVHSDLCDQFAKLRRVSRTQEVADDSKLRKPRVARNPGGSGINNNSGLRIAWSSSTEESEGVLPDVCIQYFNNIESSTMKVSTVSMKLFNAKSFFFCTAKCERRRTGLCSLSFDL